MSMTAVAVAKRWLFLFFVFLLLSSPSLFLPLYSTPKKKIIYKHIKKRRTDQHLIRSRGN